MTTDEILDILEEMFPDAHCELEHRNAFELLVAVVLSAQTTDAAVNKVTPALFEAFKTPQAMAEADIHDIEDKIRRIGLYRNKARSIQNLSRSLLESFNGVVPESMKELTSLAGVGRKTANVVRSVCFDIPSIAVDTHVERISKRLGLAKVQDSVEVVEQKLKRKLKRTLEPGTSSVYLLRTIFLYGEIRNARNVRLRSFVKRISWKHIEIPKSHKTIHCGSFF